MIFFFQMWFDSTATLTCRFLLLLFFFELWVASRLDLDYYHTLLIEEIKEAVYENGSSRNSIGQRLVSISTEDHREVQNSEQRMEIPHRLRLLQRSLHLLQLIFLPLLVNHPNQPPQTLTRDRWPPRMQHVGSRSFSCFFLAFLRQDHNQKALGLILYGRSGLALRRS